MRKLKDRIAQDELAAQDDRDMVSRSDRKRTRTGVEDAIAALGEQIVVLNPRQLASLALPEPVVDAIHDAQLIKSPIARARQMRIVRRELRAINWEPIQALLEEYLGHGFPARPKASAPAAGGAVDTWLTALLSEKDAAVQRLLEEKPAANRQQLRSAIRNYEKAEEPVREAAKCKLIKILQGLLGPS